MLVLETEQFPCIAEYSSRITLANSKLVPRIYDYDELEGLGLLVPLFVGFSSSSPSFHLQRCQLFQPTHHLTFPRVSIQVNQH